MSRRSSQYWGTCPVCSGTKSISGPDNVLRMCGTCGGTGNADVAEIVPYEEWVLDTEEKKAHHIQISNRRAKDAN